MRAPRAAAWTTRTTSCRFSVEAMPHQLVRRTDEQPWEGSDDRGAVPPGLHRAGGGGGGRLRELSGGEMRIKGQRAVPRGQRASQAGAGGGPDRSAGGATTTETTAGCAASRSSPTPEREHAKREQVAAGLLRQGVHDRQRRFGQRLVLQGSGTVQLQLPPRRLLADLLLAGLRPGEQRGGCRPGGSGYVLGGCGAGRSGAVQAFMDELTVRSSAWRSAGCFRTRDMTGTVW